MTAEKALVRLNDRVETPPANSRKIPARGPGGRAKAAIVVRLLLSEGADLPIEALPEDLQEVLTRQMGRMGLVDRETLAAVITEFAEALDGIGLSFPGGLAGALSALEGKLSPDAATRLRSQAGLRAQDPWERLRALPAEDLAAMALSESTEVAAVLLSRLETAKAAEMLGKLPGPDARRIAFAVSQTGGVSPATVERVGAALASQIDARPVPAFDSAPGERVGAILNLSPASTRDELLRALDEADAVFAGSVRRAIFTFADIPARLSPRDAPAIVRAVDPSDLVTALAAATEGPEADTAEFLLSNIPGRMADNLREEIEERGEIRPEDGEKAMNAVVAAIRDRERAGEIELRPPERDTP